MPAVFRNRGHINTAIASRLAVRNKRVGHSAIDYIRSDHSHYGYNAMVCGNVLNAVVVNNAEGLKVIQVYYTVYGCILGVVSLDNISLVKGSFLTYHIIIIFNVSILHAGINYVL